MFTQEWFANERYLHYAGPGGVSCGPSLLAWFRNFWRKPQVPALLDLDVAVLILEHLAANLLEERQFIFTRSEFWFKTALGCVAFYPSIHCMPYWRNNGQMSCRRPKGMIVIFNLLWGENTSGVIKGKSFALQSKSSPCDEQAYCGTPGGELWVGRLSLIFWKFPFRGGERKWEQNQGRGRSWKEIE